MNGSDAGFINSLDGMLLGIVSDTHGHVDERLLAAFRGVDGIIHAGDVGSTRVLEALNEIAPVHAVFGNNDQALGRLGLSEHLDFQCGGVWIHLVHEVGHARPDPETGVVVFGHSHRQLAEWRDGVLYLNPGAAGLRGFHSLQTAALLRIEDRRPQAELLVLGPRPARKPLPKPTRTHR